MADIVVQFRGTIYENGYGQISQKVMRDRSIHGMAKAIYAYLVSFAGQDGSAFPSVELMMDELGIKSDDTFYKYRNQLIDAGYISIEQQQRVKGQFYNNLYIIELSPHPKKSGTAPHPKKSGTVKSSTTKSGTTNNSSLSKTDLKNNHKNNNTDPVAVVQNDDLDVIENRIELELGTSIKSLLPQLPKWVKEQGADALIEKAQFIGASKTKWQNIIGTYRTAVVEHWDTSLVTGAFKEMTATTEKTQNQDGRYSAFYQLFPNT